MCNVYVANKYVYSELHVHYIWNLPQKKKITYTTNMILSMASLHVLTEPRV